MATVAWIAFTPVKGLRMHALQETELTEDGVPGDRAFFLVDDGGAMVSATRLGPLVGVVAHHEDGSLTLDVPGGEPVTGPVELGAAEAVRFYGLKLDARPVLGPFSEVLSEQCGTPLRMFAMPPERPGVDRGREGAVTLLSTASLERLRDESGSNGAVDERRFRMTLGVEGLTAHEEDSWIGRDVRVGEALVRVGGNVGRCAATTRNADTGVVDFKTLHYLADYRGDVQTTEPLPFGVHARVIEPGHVRLGDAVGALNGV